MSDGKTFWQQKHYRQQKLTAAEFHRAFFAHYTIKAYAVMALLAATAVVLWTADWRFTLLGAAVYGFLFPFFMYLTHRYVLHSRLLWRSRFTAKLWKRLHFDHHQDTSRLDVMFGALHTTLPGIYLTSMPIGFAIGGLGGAFAALVVGLVLGIYNEYVHFLSHMNYKPKSKKLRALKEQHLMHHFLDDTGNFAITDFPPDKVFGTHYRRSDRATGRKPSGHLGYDAEQAAKYPWVAQYSGGLDVHMAREAELDARAAG